MANARKTGNGLARVLYVAALDPRSKFGSMEEQIFILARSFKEHGGLFLPFFACPLGPEFAATFERERLQVAWADLGRFRPATLRTLLALIHQQRIEIVHWNFYHPFNPYVWALSLTCPRLKHYLTDHNSRTTEVGDSIPRSLSPAPIRRLIKRSLARRYSKVLCISDYVLRCVQHDGVWRRVSRCDHFINTERFRPDPSVHGRIRRELEAGDRFVVLVVAHLIPEKGTHVALKALSRLNDRTVLWVVGGGPESAPLQALCRELALDNRVRFLGCQRDVSQYMQAADCLVVPSLWQEAVGLTVLEGLACGLPVVASDVGGIPEFVKDGNTGFLFRAGDDRLLADIVQAIQTNPQAHHDMRLRAREEAVRRFSPDARLSDYFTLYQRPGIRSNPT